MFKLPKGNAGQKQHNIEVIYNLYLICANWITLGYKTTLVSEKILLKLEEMTA